MAHLIDGKTLAAEYKAKAAAAAAALREKGVAPRLAVIIVGENPASKTYVAGKARDCAECGILSDVLALPETTGEAELLSRIAALNADAAVHGVLVQLPLPAHIDESRVIRAIAPEKDVDGFTPVNVGRAVLSAVYPGGLHRDAAQHGPAARGQGRGRRRAQQYRRQADGAAAHRAERYRHAVPFPHGKFA